MVSKKPQISVIVPTFNSENRITQCLSGLLQQTIPQDQYEIIIVDDASTDQTGKVVQSFSSVRYLRIPHGGPSVARNAGARAALGEIVVFTDDDCIPSEDWLQCMTEPFNNPEIVGAKGAYRTDQDEVVARFVQLEYESKYIRMQKLPCIDFIDTNSAAYRKDIFLENNGFDTNFTVASVEDQEFSFRLARKGYRMVFIPKAIVYHKHDRSLREYIHRKFNIGFWKSYMLRWLPEKTLKDSYTPASQRLQILLLGMTILSLFLSIFVPTLLWGSAISIFLFFVTGIPFLTQIIRRDVRLFLPAILLLVLRSAALGFGLVAGFLFPPSIIKKYHTISISQWMIKRCLDILVSLIGLIIFLPLFPFIALAIMIDSRGPVFFIQERAGENGKPYKLVKFRTMVNGAEKMLSDFINPDDLKEPVFKIPEDPRTTRVGKFLRRWSLDEFPQFWNILRGDMSLVGPRPEETWLVERYNDNQRQRLVVKPGLTGPMQISGRGELNLSERLIYELEYIENYSLKRDIDIIVKSIPAVIRGNGAY